MPQASDNRRDCISTFTPTLINLPSHFFPMKLKKILSFLCLAAPLISAAQKNITITGNIAHLNNEKVFFRYYTGSKATYSDSLISESGKITFSVPDTLRGLSAIRVHNRPDLIIRLISNGKDISFTADANAPADSIRIISSEENKTYYRYLKQKNIAALKKDSSLPAIFARMQIPVAVPKGVDNTQQYLRAHFLDNTDLNNAGIIHTDLIRTQLNSYIELYDDGSLPFEQQVDTLCTALDKLFQRAGNEQVYNFLETDLGNRFRYGNYDILGAYITQYYTSRFSLVKDYPLAEIRQRLLKVKHPTIGQAAPEIIMDAPGGGTTKMTDIKTDYLLIIFWSTQCYHCIQTVPLLKKIYDARQPGFEILAVSFDTDAAAWQKFIQEHGLGWINYSDLKGFEGKIAKDYDVQGTPTFLLLDQNKTILAKPLELKDLAEALQQLKII